MPACRDPQHERFARELTEQYLKVPPSRQPVFDAFKAAGYAPHPGNATRLSKRKDIQRRVAELMDEAREYLDIRAVRALVRVDRIADVKLPEFYETVKEGKVTLTRLRDITTLPPRLAEAIAEIEYHEDGVTPKKVKLHDKFQANALILKYLGGVPEEEQARHAEVNIFNVLSPEDQRVLADALEALAGGTTGTGTPAAPALESVGEGT